MTPASLRFPYPVVGPSRASSAARALDSVEHETFLLHPPYERPDFLACWEELERRHLAPGSIAGIRIRTTTEWPSLEPGVRQLRARLPAAPIVLLFSDGSESDLFLSARAARAGVRAILHEHDRLPSGLHTALTCRDSLAEDVIDWLTLRRLRLSPVVCSLLREIFARAPSYPDLSTLLAEVGMAESSARFRLHKRLLPTPSRWFQAARALHSAVRVQADGHTSLLRIAHEFGYADHSALSQLVYRSFRVRPGAIRGTLGWEWLMHRWMTTIPELQRAVRPA